MSRYEQLKDIAVEKVRDLTVDRKELEDLLLILGEKSFKFKMNNDPETTWHSVREIPDRTLMIRKKDQGLSLEIAPVYSVTGIRYHMYFDNAKVYLVSRQELGAVEEFVCLLYTSIAGEEAEKISRGPGSFHVNLLDEIYGLSDRQLLDLLKIEMY